MRKNLLVICIFLVLMTSACGTPQAPPETDSPTQAVTYAATDAKTETPPATRTPPSQARATSIPETPIPTNTVDCTNSAVFVADVTIPDNSEIPLGTAFTKTWRVKNTGTCIWGPDYTLSHYSGDRMLAQPSVPLDVTFPDQTLDISIELRALGAAGTQQGYFVIKNPAGLIMKIDNDSRLWVVINVPSAVAQSTVGIPVTGGEGNFATVTCAFSTDAVKIAEAVNAINAYRAQNGLPAYTFNDQLSKAATAHANDMACNKLFGHNGSNGSTPTTRVAGSGYIAASVTENVYGNYPPLSGKEVVDWWKNDKTDLRHNQNLLSTTYTEIGLGYSFFDNFGFYVLVFGVPK